MSLVDGGVFGEVHCVPADVSWWCDALVATVSNVTLVDTAEPSGEELATETSVTNYFMVVETAGGRTDGDCV